MENIYNAHSDLIHLFIDGEATETERNILFGALKDSPELQEEFSSAMQLKQAFASDIMKLQPPSYLESQIAERAGLIVAASASLATAPVIVNSVTSALTGIAPMAATGISKAILALFIGTSIGILSTIGIIQLTKETPKEADNQSLNIERPSTIADRTSSIVERPLTVANYPNNLSTSIVDRRPSIEHFLHRSAAPLPVLHFSKSTFNDKANIIADLKNVKSTVSNGQTPSQIEGVADNINNSSSTSENKVSVMAMNPIASIDPIIPITKNLGWAAPNHSLIYEGSDGFFREPDWMVRVSIAYRGMPAAKLYQGQNDNASVPPWNNMGWALKYELDPFSSIAVEGGLETFPVYLASAGGGFTGHHSIGWGGASYTYSFTLAEVLSIHPEVRALGGISTAGPIVKFSAGLVYQPVGQFSFSVDPEYTASFIKENGALRAGSKLGLTYSLRFHF